MKLFIHIILIAFLSSLPMMSDAQKKEVIIRIVQDEHHVLLDKFQTNISLKRKGFKIQVLLSNVSGVYSFAGFTDSVCCKLGEIDTMPHFTMLPDITMQEPDFNKEKELLVGEKECSYWYYDRNLSAHRFNKKVVLLDSNRYVGVKSVKQVYYVPEQKQIKFKDLKTPIYLFFVAVDEFDDKGKPKKELMRRKVKIDWLNDD